MSVAIQPRLFGLPQQELTSDDYYTPPWVFERMAIEFDLDVCAPPGGIEWIPANHHYTQEDDGLASEWYGRVWMNPPYSDSAPWVRRFIEHRNGIAMVQHCRSAWHRDLWLAADGFVDPAASTPTGSLFQFIRDGKYEHVYMPVTVVAFGDECVEAISRLGRVRR